MSITFGSFHEKNSWIPEPIFQNILSFFSARKLLSLMEVCKSWKGAAEVAFKATLGSALGVPAPFNQEAISQAFSKLLKSKKVFDSFIEMRKKDDPHSSFELTGKGAETASGGMQALTKLYQLDFVSAEELKNYTLTCNAWHPPLSLVAAQAYIERGDLQSAKEVLMKTPQTLDIGTLVLTIIKKECEANNSKEALQTYTDFSKRLKREKQTDARECIKKAKAQSSL